MEYYSRYECRACTSTRVRVVGAVQVCSNGEALPPRPVAVLDRRCWRGHPRQVAEGRQTATLHPSDLRFNLSSALTCALRQSGSTTQWSAAERRVSARGEYRRAGATQSAVLPRAGAVADQPGRRANTSPRPAQFQAHLYDGLGFSLRFPSVERFLCGWEVSMLLFEGRDRLLQWCRR